MSSTYCSLADLVKVNDLNARDDGVSDLLDDAPLLRVLGAGDSSNGTLHKYLKETGAPTPGFRAVNAGLDNTASSDTLITVTLQILDASFAVDKALADAYKAGPEAYVAREARRHLKAAFFHAEKQIINGTGNEGDGFDGLADTLDVTDDAMVVSAGGSTALSSVYFIRTGNDFMDCQVVMANNGQLEVGETVVQRLATTDTPPKYYPGYYTPIESYMGLQVGSAYSVARLANVDNGTYKLTDTLIYSVLKLFPAGRQPNLIVMNRRDQANLRASRTATNATGAPAPLPQDVEGIKIVVTDAITTSESAVTASSSSGSA